MQRVLAHASRRLWSWLIFDVRQKMLLRILKVMLVLPAFIMTPLGWAVMAGGAREALPSIVYFFLSSAIGLASLLIAMLCDLRFLRSSARWLLVVGLAIGIQLAVYMITRAPPRHGDVTLLAIWLIGGPLLVAIRCVYLLLLPRETPNKAPEPTPGLVTPRALE
jgi:hypothetical protein